VKNAREIQILKDRPVIVVYKRAATKNSRSGPIHTRPHASSSVTKVATSGTAKPGLNKKGRERQARQELLEVLCSRWPRAFPRDEGQVRPLAIGIRQDLAFHLPEQPPGRIGFVIGMFQCLMGPAYLRAVVQGGPRYDLDGHPRGEVTPKEREQAGRALHAFHERKKNGDPGVRLEIHKK